MLPWAFDDFIDCVSKALRNSSTTDMQSFQACVKRRFPESCHKWNHDSDYADILHAIYDEGGRDLLDYVPLFHLLKRFVNEETRVEREAYRHEVSAYFISEKIFRWTKKRLSNGGSLSPQPNFTPRLDIIELGRIMEPYNFTEASWCRIQVIWDETSEQFRLPRLDVVLHAMLVESTSVPRIARSSISADDELNQNVSCKIGKPLTISQNNPKATEIRRESLHNFGDQKKVLFNPKEFLISNSHLV